MLQPLAKNVLILLRLTVTAVSADAGIHKKTLSSGHGLDIAQRTKTLLKSNKEMEDIKIVKPLEDSGLIIKGVTQTIENEAENKGADFLVCYEVH